MAISNAFKSAYTNQVTQQNQGINTITAGVKDLATTIAGVAGFTGALGSGVLAQGAKHALAGRVGGVGGNIMLSVMQEKTQTAKANEERGKLFTSDEVSQTISSTPVDTVFETLQRAKEQNLLNQKGTIDSSIGEIDPNSELGKRIVEQMGGNKNDNDR